MLYSSLDDLPISDPIYYLESTKIHEQKIRTFPTEFPKIKNYTTFGFARYFLALFDNLFVYLYLPHGRHSLKLLILFFFFNKTKPLLTFDTQNNVVL